MGSHRTKAFIRCQIARILPPKPGHGVDFALCFSVLGSITPGPRVRTKGSVAGLLPLNLWCHSNVGFPTPEDRCRTWERVLGTGGTGTDDDKALICGEIVAVCPNRIRITLDFIPHMACAAGSAVPPERLILRIGMRSACNSALSISGDGERQSSSSCQPPPEPCSAVTGMPAALSASMSLCTVRPDTSSRSASLAW
jgi:hypothetical protein